MEQRTCFGGRVSPSLGMARLALGILIACSWAAGAIASEAPVEKPYSATARLGVSQPGEPTSEEDMLNAETAANLKIYVDGGETRIEMSRDGVAALIRIAHEKEGKLYIVSPGSRQVRVFPRTEKTTDLIDALSHFQLSMGTLVGTEQVEGRACAKYKTVLKDRPAFIWLDAQTGIPLKIGDGKYFVLTFNSFKYDDQDKTLFAPPVE